MEGLDQETIRKRRQELEDARKELQKLLNKVDSEFVGLWQECEHPDGVYHKEFDDSRTFMCPDCGEVR